MVHFYEVGKLKKARPGREELVTTPFQIRILHELWPMNLKKIIITRKKGRIFLLIN